MGDLIIRSTTDANNTTAPKGLYMRYDGTNDIGLIESIDKTTGTEYPLNIKGQNINFSDNNGNPINIGIGVANP